MNLFDNESEQVILGSLLQSPELFSDISLEIRPEDFYFEANSLIFQSCSELVDAGNQPEPLLLINHLKEKSLLEKVGSRTYVMQVAGQAATVGIQSYTRRVRDLAMRRGLLSQLREVQKQILEDQVPLDEVFNQTERALYQAADRGGGYNVSHLREFKEEFIDYLKAAQANKGGVTGLISGFKNFDELTGGLKGGQLIILAARPGVGKTTLALNMAANAALRGNAPVLFFSLEMSRLELFLRLVCSDAMLESQKIQKGFLSENDSKKVLASSKRLYETDFYIDDSADLGVWDFKQRSRRWAARMQSEKKKPGLIIVDYLQLMTDRGRSESRQVEVASISRALKMTAKDLDVPVIALSQMNRSIEQRGKDPRPQLSDLRESGAIEQDADIVLFIHREDLYKKDLPESEQNVADLIVAKHRAGSTGNYKLAFLKQKNLFLDIDPAD
jgi:replicative DNA helicase